MVDGLLGLRHYPIVRGHHEDRYVCYLGASGAHCRERLMARSVQEGDEVLLVLDLLGPDVLGDAAGLTGHDLAVPYGVQQRRLAMVDVSQDGHDGRPRLEEARVRILLLYDLRTRCGGGTSSVLAIFLAGRRI